MGYALVKVCGGFLVVAAALFVVFLILRPVVKWILWWVFAFIGAYAATKCLLMPVNGWVEEKVCWLNGGMLEEGFIVSAEPDSAAIIRTKFSNSHAIEFKRLHAIELWDAYIKYGEVVRLAAVDWSDKNE